MVTFLVISGILLISGFGAWLLWTLIPKPEGRLTEAKVRHEAGATLLVAGLITITVDLLFHYQVKQLLDDRLGEMQEHFKKTTDHT